jgi:undecaprenyl-diphosphatase
MMIWLEILVLAVVQGIGEFLPISSSGHVVVGLGLFEQFGYSIPEKLTVNIVLHVGTLLAILVFYRQRIWRLLGEDCRVIGLLLVGSLPAAAVGIVVEATPLGSVIRKSVLENPLVAGLMFPITGLMLLWTAGRGTGRTTCRELGYGRALLVGAFQAFAILPGISRSGATIVAGLGSGLQREEAAAFSFLLAIPAIGGAGLLESVKLWSHSADSTSPEILLVGAAVSFVIGLGSLWWLVRWLRQGRLHYFACWVIPVGLAVVTWQLL